jgi:hypothetical protein
MIQGSVDLTWVILALEEMAALPQSQATMKALQRFSSVYTSAMSLQQIHRFLHYNHVYLNGDVLPDGSNLSKLIFLGHILVKLNH